MASEDVIELGSSDEDTQPAPKKAKPMPNAMVCIPNKFPGVTIKPTKTNPKSITKVLGKAITVTKMSNVMIANPFANKGKVNGKPGPKSSVKLPAPVKIQNKILNAPIKSNITIVKVAHQQQNSNIPTTIIKNPIRIQSPRTLNLPSSITVKRTAPMNKQIGYIVANVPKVKRKPNINPKKVAGEVLTVELDDDEGTSSTSGPQWYIRPEEGETKKVEEQNNKEPETTNFIEITIEDSPVKPITNKRAYEVGTELAITIDDSPVKPPPEKNKADSGSDHESIGDKVPHSKKKLEYPKEAGNEQNTIEIEVDPLETHNDIITGDLVTSSAPVDKRPETLQADMHNTHTSTPKKNNPSITEKPKEVIVITDSSEFHPVYESFIDLCFKLENSEDMTKIVEKKIKAYYRQVPKEYTESEEFIDMVLSKVLSMKAGPEKMYLYIKDIVDELNLQRKLAKSQVVTKEANSGEPEQSGYAVESEFDAKRRRQIRKLEKTIKKLHRAIQKLEEQEVDFDDEDDSVYLLTERYKERMVRVYAKFCQLTNTKMPSEPRIQIDGRPGQPAGPAKRLEKWINKKVPIGSPLPFPDFHDVLRCVKEANDEDKLGWNEVDVMEEARDLFMRCGKKLQRRRQENEWRSAASRLALDVDPAEKNDDLKKRLDDNKQLATKKEIEIFNKYADRQNLLKLEAVEIGDKEAEESPVESEDEEANEDETVSLENKDKRKERLKRLLQEKSKKEKGEGKENKPTNDLQKPETTTETPEIVANVETIEVEKELNKLESKDDSTKVTEKQANHEKTPARIEIAHSISSDDSNKVESDIDELHLLQKLHSGNEAESSTLESSDSESPIAISESLESTDDGKPKQSSDVISIENSSYSETEADKEDSNDKEVTPNKSTEKLINLNHETDNSVEGTTTGTYSVATPSVEGDEKVQNKTNNDEYNESVENILLASSDDETEKETSESSKADASESLRDDIPTIDKNVDDNANQKNAGEHSVVTESIDVDIVNDMSGQENLNNNMEGENNSHDLTSVEESTTSIDKYTEKNADKETDPLNDEAEPMILNDIVSIPINNIDSSESSQDVVMKDVVEDDSHGVVDDDSQDVVEVNSQVVVEVDSQDVVEGDSTPAKVVSAHNKSNEKAEKMDVDEVENKLSVLFSDDEIGSEVNVPKAITSEN